MKIVSTSFTITTVIPLMMCCIVPAGSPRQFTGIDENSTSIIVSWSAPATPNGVITEYQLQCSGGGQVFSRTGLTDHNHTEWTCYHYIRHTSIRMTANFLGPPATVPVMSSLNMRVPFNEI